MTCSSTLFFQTCHQGLKKVVPHHDFWKGECPCKLPEIYISDDQFWDEPPVDLFLIRFKGLRIERYLLVKSAWNWNVQELAILTIAFHLSGPAESSELRTQNFERRKVGLQRKPGQRLGLCRQSPQWSGRGLPAAASAPPSRSTQAESRCDSSTKADRKANSCTTQ